METLLDLFHEFKERGKSTALVYRTGARRFTYSYAWLHDQALRCSAWLEQQGVGPGDRVVLWAPNSPWWVVAFWGILARGAVVVPVDFTSGRERVEKIQQLTQAKLILQSFYKLTRLHGPGVVEIEQLEYALASVEPVQTYAPAVPEQTAELIYTSGTTGDPKGVVLTHQNIVSNLVSVNQFIGIQKGARFLSVLPLSHMFEQVCGFLTPFYRGGSVIYLRTVKPGAIALALHQENVQYFMLVPRLLQALRSGIERELTAKHLKSVFDFLLRAARRWPLWLRKIIFAPVRSAFGHKFNFFVSGGAALPIELGKFWSTLGFSVVEGYGLTECSPILTANQPSATVLGSAGKVIPGVQLRIESGEVQARGANVFSGYYQNPVATAEAFTPDGWFKTGDLGSFDAQGNLFLKGRRKEVVVTGAGVNVYPDDIEPLLNKISGVREGCIVGLDQGQGEEVHAVLLLDGSGRELAAIIRELNSKLDAVQQVTSFTLWPETEFPKTSTLKVQKFKVRDRIKLGSEPAHGATADKLAQLVASVTGRPAAEVTEQAVLAIDLGLTSIARLELVNYLEQEFRLDLDDSAITQNTTVADLRRMVRERKITRSSVRLRPWLNARWVRAIRRLASPLWQVIFGRLVQLEVRGAEHLAQLSGPVLFVSNHTSYIDGFAIWFTLPPRYRYYYSTAAGDEFFFEPGAGLFKKIIRRVMYEYLSFFGNAFILPEKAGFKQAVQHMGWLIDQGVSVLYFPEGGLQRPGVVLPYQLGIGLIVQELKVPVVPIKLAGLVAIVAPDTAKLKRGSAMVTFGPPLKFTIEQPSEIVGKIQQAIETL